MNASDAPVAPPEPNPGSWVRRGPSVRVRLGAERPVPPPHPSPVTPPPAGAAR